LSLRATRRSLIAALTVGASLAVASSASAIPVPIGSSTDAPYSGTGTPASVYALYNEATNVALVPAAGLIQLTNVVDADESVTPVDGSFPATAVTASSLTSSLVTEIATDIAASANTSKLEVGACVQGYLTQTGGSAGNQTQRDTGYAYCNSPGGASALAAATTAFTGTVQPGVAAAAAAWPNLSQLVGFLGSASGVMQSADSATMTSSGTVTSLTDPVAYNVTLSAPANGYVVPSAFSMTFPAGLSVNTALVADEVNAATNTAAVELNPTGTPIGTVTLTSPLANAFGGSNNQLVGSVYVVQTGQSSGQGSATQPYLELWFPAGGHPIYDLGSFPNSLSFPLTLTFGEAYVSLLGTDSSTGLPKQEPLPLNSLALSFPAATSPVKTSSCTTLGTASGAITDSIAGLAYEFGDTSDGVTTVTGTPAAVNLAATPTAVTDQCVAAPPPVKSTARGVMHGLTGGSPTLTLKVKTGTAFGTVTIGLPHGLSFVKASRKILAKEISGKAKSVRIAHGKLVVTLRKRVTSATIITKKGLISESLALIKSIKKHRTKTLRISVHAGSKALTAIVKA
jgi:hypothetical protein